MLRVIALALSLALSLGVIIPLATNHSEAGPKQYKKNKKKKLKKYSKAWWRAYHRNQKRKRAIAARKRALKARQARLARQRLKNGGNESIAKVSDKSGKSRQKVSVKENSATAILPSGESAPNGWKRAQDNKGELQFRVDDDGGRQIGSASLAVVGPSMGADSDNSARNKTLGGVSTSALRRTVIDRMMKEDGWVVNDYQKVLDGKKVYVVVAQSRGMGNQVQSRTFYFTEVEGRIYSLSTNAPNEASERLAQESEKVINSLQRANRPTQAELR